MEQGNSSITISFDNDFIILLSFFFINVFRLRSWIKITKCKTVFETLQPETNAMNEENHNPIIVITKQRSRIERINVVDGLAGFLLNEKNRLYYLENKQYC